MLHVLVATILSLRVLYRKLQVNSALAWIVVLIAMPIGGPVLYVLFGDPNLGRRRLELGHRIRSYYEKAYAIARADAASVDAIPSLSTRWRLRSRGTAAFPCSRITATRC
jgi:cardiolipin synthase